MSIKRSKTRRNHERIAALLVELALFIASHFAVQAIMMPLDSAHEDNNDYTINLFDQQRFEERKSEQWREL